jgi:cytochrome c-type biogenesis protein CcmH
MTMILFWAVSALLAAGVLILILRPLLASREEDGVSPKAANLAIYRDQLRELEADLEAGTLKQEDYEAARRELESRLLEDVAHGETASRPGGGRKVTWAVAAAIPLLAVVLYLAIGRPEALDPEYLPEAAHGVTTAQIEAMAERLAERLREDPDDVEGWRILGRTYSALGRMPEAAKAYGEAASRAPRDAQLLADFADALAVAQGRSLEGEPEKLVLRALEIEPTNMKALALAGTAAYQRKDYAVAAGYWERMLALVPPGSEDAQSIRANVEEARALAGQKPSASQPAPAAEGPRLTGEVRLAPEVAGKASPDDTVFIFARAADGPQRPLAVARKQVRDLPAEFSLDDSMAMTPEMGLSKVPSVVVVARVSASGSSSPQPGDLQGVSQPVRSDASGVTVVIASEVR